MNNSTLFAIAIVYNFNISWSFEFTIWPISPALEI